MRLGVLLVLGSLLAVAACAPTHEPPPTLAVTDVPAPPITGTVVVQPQP